jgi:uncharacterized RDD family membrane protein YckC
MKKCPHCGKEYPDDATICFIDETPLDPEPPGGGLSQDKSPYAGFGIRLLARIIDTIFGFFIGYAAGIFAGTTIVGLADAGTIPPGWQERLREFSLIPFGCGLLGNIAYHFFCEGVHGATLGKLCCGLRVVTEDGRPSNLKGAMIRTLAYYIDSFFFGMVGYDSMQKSPLNQRYGDQWGKTAVVKIKLMPAEAQRPSALFIAGLLIGVTCCAGMLAIGLIFKAF